MKGKDEVKYTPGPWEIRKAPNDPDEGFISARRLMPDHPYDVEVLAEDHFGETDEDLYPMSRWKADVQLTSQAPNMYELLERLSAEGKLDEQASAEFEGIRGVVEGEWEDVGERFIGRSAMQKGEELPKLGGDTEGFIL